MQILALGGIILSKIMFHSNFSRTLLFKGERCNEFIPM